MSAELRSQVSYVQQTGETLRRETAALVNAFAEAADPWLLGRDPAQARCRAGGHDRTLRLRSAVHDQGRRSACCGRTCVSTCPRASTCSWTPKSRSRAFLEAAETDDPQLKADASCVTHGTSDPYRPALRKQYWKLRRRPSSSCCSCRTRCSSRPLLIRFQISTTTRRARRRGVGDADDAHRHAARGGIRLAAGRPRGKCERGISGSAASCTRSWACWATASTSWAARCVRSVNAYNETIATVEGTVLVRARKFRDLKVSEKGLPRPTQIDEPVRQIQAAELVEDASASRDRWSAAAAGDTRRRCPKTAELYRGDPELVELIEETSATEPRARLSSHPDRPVMIRRELRSARGWHALCGGSLARSSGGRAKTSDSSVSRSSRATRKALADQVVQDSRTRSSGTDAPLVTPIESTPISHAGSISVALSMR